MITDVQAQHYLFEIVRETELSARLFRRFQVAAESWLQLERFAEPDGLALWKGTEAEREMEEAIEGLLSTFARISLFLFPDRSTGSFGSERGKRLRELTSVADDNPIGNRALRNHWMHLDHRFDTFVREHGTPPVGYHLGSAHRLSSVAKSEMLRLVDPQAETVFVLGKGFDLLALADAVEHVGQQAALAIIDGKTQ